MLAQEYGFSVCILLRSALVFALIVSMSAYNRNNFAAVKYDGWDKGWDKVQAPYVQSDKNI